MKLTLSQNKIVLGSIAILLLIPLLFIGQIFAGFWFRSHQLDREAARNEHALKGITILSDQPTDAIAEPDGDALTGSSSPARARFAVDRMLGDVYQEITNNLSSQGYQIEGDFETKDNSRNTRVSYVRINTVNDDKAIIVDMTLRNPIECEVIQGVGIATPCNYEKPVTLETSGLYEQEISKVSVIYDDLEDLSFLFNSHF